LEQGGRLTIQGGDAVNPVLGLLLKRKSIRAYQDREISQDDRAAILRATLRAPTAGNMMLYSIIEVRDRKAKQTLVRTCDNQPFIARAPLVLLFLADYQRWFDYFMLSTPAAQSGSKEASPRKPEEGDLLIACCDAVIAAHTSVIAAESLGIGSCYIGDILENYEQHRDLFNLPDYVLPICLVCFGYPTRDQVERPLTQRYEERFIVFEDRYRRLREAEFLEMFHGREEVAFRGRETVSGARNYGQLMYLRKYGTDFAREMNRSVRAMLKTWAPDRPG
jgi:nitroreductase